MPNSLKVMIKKLAHKGQISSEECNELLSKLDGHDKQIRENVFKEIAYSDDVIKEPFERLAYQKGMADAFEEFVRLYKVFQDIPCNKDVFPISCDGMCIDCFEKWVKEQK